MADYTCSKCSLDFSGDFSGVSTRCPKCLRTTTVIEKGARRTIGHEFQRSVLGDPPRPKQKANVALIIVAVVATGVFRLASKVRIDLTYGMTLSDLLLASGAIVMLVLLVRAMRREGIETLRVRTPGRLLVLLLMASCLALAGAWGTLYLFSDPLGPWDAKGWATMHRWSWGLFAIVVMVAAGWIASLPIRKWRAMRAKP